MLQHPNAACVSSYAHPRDSQAKLRTLPGNIPLWRSAGGSATSGNGRPRQEVAADEPHHLIESSQVERARTASQRLMEVWNGIGMASSSKTKPKTPAQLLPSVLSVSLRFVPLAVGCCTVPQRRVALLPYPLHPLSCFGTTAVWPQVGARPMQSCLFFFCPSAHHSLCLMHNSTLLRLTFHQVPVARHSASAPPAHRPPAG